MKRLLQSAIVLLSAVLLTACAGPTATALPPTAEPTETLAPTTTSTPPTPSATVTRPTPEAPTTFTEPVLLARAGGALVLRDPTKAEDRLLLEHYLPVDPDASLVHLLWPVRLSPDAQWLLVPTDHDGTWLVSLDGETRWQISEERLSGTWATDSHHVVFTRERGPTEREEDHNIYIQDVVGRGEAQVLAQLPQAASYPTASPRAPGCDTGDMPGDCGRSVAAYACDISEVYDCTVWLIALDSQEMREVGHFAPLPMMFGPEVIRWSPDSTEVWVNAWFGARAFPIDGSGPRPLVYAPAMTVAHEGPQPGTSTTDGDMILGTLKALQQRSTEIGGPRVTVRMLPESGDPAIWEEEIVSFARLRVPPKWHFQADRGYHTLANFDLEGKSGFASLGNEHLQITIGMHPDVPSQLDFDAWLQQLVDLEQAQVTAEAVTVGGRPAARIRPLLDPISEEIRVPLENGAEWSIRRTPLNPAQDALFQQILDSVTFEYEP
jgi:hypothetical protein